MFIVNKFHQNLVDRLRVVFFLSLHLGETPCVFIIIIIIFNSREYLIQLQDKPRLSQKDVYLGKIVFFLTCERKKSSLEIA